EGRRPSRAFDGTEYLRLNPDVLRAGVNPLVHYVRSGRREKREVSGRSIAPEIENTSWWHALQPETRALEMASANVLVPACPPAIIIPVYNAAEELRACLRALRRNTESPYRLIVIDDASPDPAIEALLDGIADWPELERYRNPENLGFTRTINRG